MGVLAVVGVLIVCADVEGGSTDGCRDNLRIGADVSLCLPLILTAEAAEVQWSRLADVPLLCALYAPERTFSPSCSPPILRAVGGKMTLCNGGLSPPGEVDCSLDGVGRPATDDILPSFAALTNRRTSLAVSESYGGLSTPEAPAPMQAEIVLEDKAGLAEYARTMGRSI